MTRLCIHNPIWTEQAFTTYIKRRPTDSLKPESKLYLSILTLYHNKGLDDLTQKKTKGIWYSMQPISKNKLGDLLKVMSVKGRLTGRRVIYYERKPTVTSLLHSHVEATTVKQLTGHNHGAFINDYNLAS